MGLDFLEFNALAQDFYLVIDPAEVMEDAALILTGEVAGEIPGLPADGGKASMGEIRLAVVALGELAAGDGELPFVAGW